MKATDIPEFIANMRRSGIIVEFKYDYEKHRYSIVTISPKDGVYQGFGGTMLDAVIDLLKWEKQ